MKKIFLLFLFFFSLLFILPAALGAVGDIWITDDQQGVAYHFNNKGTLINKYSSVFLPSKIIADENGAWVFDKGHQRIVYLEDDAKLVFSLNDLSTITDFAVSQDAIFVLDGSRGQIIVYDHKGEELQRFGDFYLPKLLDIDKQGSLYVGDKRGLTKLTANGSILFFTPFSNLLSFTPSSDRGAWASDGQDITLSKLSSQGEVQFSIDRYRRVTSLALLPSQGVFLLDKDNRKIAALDDLGREVLALSPADLANVRMLTYDSSTDSLLVISPGKIFQFSRNGELLQTISSVKSPSFLSIAKSLSTSSSLPISSSSKDKLPPPKRVPRLPPHQESSYQKTQAAIQNVSEEKNQENKNVTLSLSEQEIEAKNADEEKISEQTSKVPEEQNIPFLEKNFLWTNIPLYWIVIGCGVFLIILIPLLVVHFMKR